MTKELYKPIIVVGAGRSGTTMIREALSQHEDVGICEYEMNYLWRYGHRDLNHDFLVPEEHLTPKIKQFIRKNLGAQQHKQKRPRLLDKTVANVVRLRYVQSVLPECKIVHIIRDGRAVTASAIKCWKASKPASYYLSKVLTIPWKDIPIYGEKYFKNLFKSKLSGRNYRQSWGPRFPGIDEVVREKLLAQVCAIQWRKSVESALAQKNYLKPRTYLEVRYEELVTKPSVVFQVIRDFLELPNSNSFNCWLKTKIDNQRQNKWQKELSPEKLQEIVKEIKPLLINLNYIK